MKLKIPFMGLRLRSSDVTGHIHEKRTPPPDDFNAQFKSKRQNQELFIF